MKRHRWLQELDSCSDTEQYLKNMTQRPLKEISIIATDKSSLDYVLTRNERSREANDSSQEAQLRTDGQQLGRYIACRRFAWSKVVEIDRFIDLIRSGQIYGLSDAIVDCDDSFFIRDGRIDLNITRETYLALGLESKSTRASSDSKKKSRLFPISIDAAAPEFDKSTKGYSRTVSRLRTLEPCRALFGVAVNRETDDSENLKEMQSLLAGCESSIVDNQQISYSVRNDLVDFNLWSNLEAAEKLLQLQVHDEDDVLRYEKLDEWAQEYLNCLGATLLLYTSMNSEDLHETARCIYIHRERGLISFEKAQQIIKSLANLKIKEGTLAVSMKEFDNEPISRSSKNNFHCNRVFTVATVAGKEQQKIFGFLPNR